MNINKHNIILFASNGNNIGKTTTAKQLKEYLSNQLNNPDKKLNEYIEYIFGESDCEVVIY